MANIEKGVQKPVIARSQAMYSGAKLPQNPEVMLNRLRNQVALSQRYLEQRRDRILERWAVYKRHALDPIDDRLKGNSLFVVIDLYMALDASDDITVEFASQDAKPLAKEKAQYITANAENDHKVGQYEMVKIQSNFQKYLTGCGVRYFNRWNKFQLFPEVVAVPTLSVLFDPEGTFKIQDHRWVGFAMRYNALDMLSKGSGFIPEVVEKLVMDVRPMHGTSDEEEDSDVVEQEQGYSDLETTKAGTEQSEPEPSDPNDIINADMRIIDVYDIYTTFYDEKAKKQFKYLITVDRDMHFILRCKKLTPTNREERANPTRVPYPVEIDHYYPVVEQDPIGLSVADLMESDQAAITTILNNAKELLYRNLSNGKIVRKGSLDADDITYAQDEITEVDIAEGEKIQDSVMTTPVQPVDIQSVIALIDAIERKVDKTTGVDENILGIGSDRVETLGEAKQLQNNANIRHKNRIRKTLESDQRFYDLWFKEYKRNYKGTGVEKKTISIQSGETTIAYSMSKADFNEEYPEIITTSKLIKIDDGKVKYDTLAANLPNISILGNPTLYRRALREMLSATMVLSDSDIEAIVGKTALEVVIEAENNLLANNIPLDLLETDEIETRLASQLKFATDAGRKRRQDLLAAAKRVGVPLSPVQQGAPQQAPPQGGTPMDDRESPQQQVKEGLRTVSVS